VLITDFEEQKNKRTEPLAESHGLKHRENE